MGPHFDATVLWVAIASPGDIKEDREQVSEAIWRWNGDNAEQYSVCFFPLMWEKDVASRVGSGDAQSVVNRRIISRASVLIALFGSRVGSETDRAISGTVEEINEARRANVPVHVFESESPIERSSFDHNQFSALQEYLTELKRDGLVLTYDKGSLSDRVYRALTEDAKDFTADFDRLIQVSPGVFLECYWRRTDTFPLLVVHNRSKTRSVQLKLLSIRRQSGIAVSTPGLNNRFSLNAGKSCKYLLGVELMDDETLSVAFHVVCEHLNIVLEVDALRRN